MADLKFRARAHSENATKTVVKASGFTLTIDEPESLGGTNSGANPVEFLLAAFAGCLNVMSHVVANEMNFTLRGVKIELSGNLNPDKLMGNPTEDRAGYKNIDIKIKPDTDADNATLEKWLEQVEDRCPISDNLQNITPVSISLK